MRIEKGECGRGSKSDCCNRNKSINGGQSKRSDGCQRDKFDNCYGKWLFMMFVQYFLSSVLYCILLSLWFA